MFEKCQIKIGAVSANLHMLNEESRKYFKRAFLSSSTALSYYTFNKTNHLQEMRHYAEIEDKYELIEYLKNEKSHVLSKYPYVGLPWLPTIEHPNVVNAFMTKLPEEIYDSDNAPVMDVLFGFNTQVIYNL